MAICRTNSISFASKFAIAGEKVQYSCLSEIRSFRFKIILFLAALSLIPLNYIKADTTRSEPVKIFNGYDIYATSIIREGNVWKQWFGGWMKAEDLPWDRMYYSISEDSGNTWSDPVEIFTIENVQVNDPSVIKLWDQDNSRYYYQMYYTYYPSGYGDATNYIAVSTSLDGINWTHHGDQEKGVLIGADNGIDLAGAWAPSALSLDSLGSEIYLYFHNNIPTGVYRTTLSNKGLVFNKETTISVSGGFKANVDVSIAPDNTWWMFYNSPGMFENGEGKFETSKMYSEDGVNWLESFYNPPLAFPDQITVTPHVVWEDSLNYQIWYGLGPSIVDFDVYMQSFQLEAEPFLPVVASSEALSVLGPENAIDGDINSFWASRGYLDDIHNEWIYLDFDEFRNVYQIILSPRVDENAAICFPPDFSLQYSLNGFDWTEIQGQSYRNYTRADLLANIFTLAEPQTAHYIRVNASRLNADVYKNYYFQLSEFDVVHDLSDVILNNNPYLASITINGTEISNFSSTEFEYGINVNEGAIIEVGARAFDSNADIKIVQDSDRITIAVVAEDDVNTANYILFIHFFSRNTNLSSIEVNGIELSDFSPNKYEYFIDIELGTNILVTASPEDSNARVEISQQEDRVSLRVIAENIMDVAHYYININYTTALESDLPNRIRIFPNPAKEKLLISNTQNTYIFIYSLNGQVVYSDKSLTTDQTIDLNNLAPGIYLIRIIGSNFVYSQKISIH